MPFRVDLLAEPTDRDAVAVNAFPAVYVYRADAVARVALAERSGGRATIRTTRALEFGRRELRAIRARFALGQYAVAERDYRPTTRVAARLEDV